LSLLDTNYGYQNLLADQKSGAFGHAYLIISEDDQVRKAVFKKISLAVFCPTSCGECAHCKKILSNNHINIRVLDGKNRIKVAEINELIENTHILPIDGDKKLYFIDNAELLDPRVQNKLLKTYEEPPSYVTIFLGSANESGLLSTIKSRGKRIYIEPFSAIAVYDELVESGFDEILSQEAASYSAGSMEKALLFVNDERYKNVYEETFNTMMSLKNSSQIIDHLYKDIFSKDNIRLTLDFMEIFLSDIIKIITKSNLEKSTLNRDYDLNKLSKGLTLAGVSMALNAINDARKRLNFNVSALSVAEKVMFDILEAKYKWQQ
jgi:DNA polymerase III delta prime subunit